MPDDLEARLRRWGAVALAWSRRVWAAIRRAWAEFFGMVDDPPPAGTLTYYQQLDEVRIPARGDVFEFDLHVTLVWTSEGLRPQELKERSWAFHTRPRREVVRTAADLARRYPPHRSRELELALNRQLVDKTWTFPSDSVTLRCRPEVRVRLDERLRADLAPIWQRMARLEAEYEVNLRRTELVADLNRRWLAILEELQGSPVASSAARLTEQDFAEAVGHLSTGQQEAVNRIRALLKTIKNDGSNGGLGDGERSQLNDVLIEALREQLISDSKDWLDKRGKRGKRPA